MTKPLILLGAGASVDAGLPNAYDLTEIVYRKLRSRDDKAARLFGFVISKLLVRAARRGGSPFDKINIEEAYDALKRLLNREGDVLGEFVSSWEPLIDLAVPQRFTSYSDLRSAISVHVDRISGRVTTDIDERRLKSGLEKLLGLRTQGVDTPGILREYVNVLANILDPPDPELTYLADFVANIASKVECVATLNYDRLMERSAEIAKCEVDYGLTDWNSNRAIRFQQGCLRLIKLHGSVNWHLKDHDEISFNPSPNFPRAVIFGGQNEKLTPNGPFLALRHEFQRLLSKSNTLAVVGYSFSDDHLNAIIRSWLAVKRKAKLIVVGPDGLDKARPVFRAVASWGSTSFVSNSVELIELRKGFSNAIDELLSVLWTPPKPSGIPQAKTQTKVPRHSSSLRGLSRKTGEAKAVTK